MFCLKSSNVVNRKLNRLLVWLLSGTPWHAMIDERGFQLNSDDPNGKFFSGLFVRLRWFNRRNTLSFRVQIAHDLEDTFMIVMSLPWLVWFAFSVDIGWLDRIERWLGQFGRAQYGYEVDRKRIQLMWGYSAASDAKQPGWVWRYEWERFNGHPTRVTTAGETTEIVYTQPRAQGYQASVHSMLLIPIRTITRWPVFWKRDKVVEGIEIYVENPPMYPVPDSLYDDGVYRLFVPKVTKVEDAVVAYEMEVMARRSAGTPQ